MRKASLAEWILSRATTPERAQTVVGDLIEQEPSRGVLWFWRCVLRMAVAFTIANRGRMMWQPLRVIADSTVWMVLTWEFVGGGWRGTAYYFIAILVWGFLTDKVLRWPSTTGHLKLRFAWMVACLVAFGILHVR